MKTAKTLRTYRAVALGFAIVLCGLVTLLMGAAIFDVFGMHNKVKDVQAFLGGFAVLAASLFSFYSVTAATAETFRKTERDHQMMVENTLLNVVLLAEALRQQSHARLWDLKKQTNDFQTDSVSSQFHVGLSIMLPEQAKTIWTNMTLVPQDAQLQYLNLVNMVTMAEQERCHADSTSTHLRENYSGAIAMLEKEIEKGKFEENENARQILNNMKKSAIEANRVQWSRLTGALANINHTAIDLLSRLPASIEWRPDIAPYPPNFQPNEYTKPGTQILHQTLRI